MIEVKFTCANVQEFNNLLKLLAAGNEEAASSYEDKDAEKHPGKVTGMTWHPEPQALPVDEPVAEETPAEEPKTVEEAPVVSLQDLQTLGRKLAADGKGAAIQAILKEHGVKLMSKIPEADRAAVYAELQEVE